MPAEPPPVTAAGNRTWGYPTDQQCSDAVRHLMRVAKTNADAAKQMREFGEDRMYADAFDECRRKFLLGQVDCINGASKFEELDSCMSANVDVPDGIDVTTAPGRATDGECKLALERFVTLAPQEYTDDSEKAAVVDQCLRYWRPYVFACVHAATTIDAAKTCARQ
jgi:hypothetical protein